MPSSETSNPYDAIVASLPPQATPEPAPAPGLTALLPLALALLVAALIGAAIWRKRETLAPGRVGRRAFAALLAILAAVWFFWFTGTLNGDEARAYAIATPAVAAAMFAAWKLAAR